MLDESQVIDEDIEQVMEDKPKDFDDVDLSILDSEFNLELFEDSADEQVVADVEKIVSECSHC